MTREKAVAGHTLAACGISSSVISVGRMTVKPETKYSVKNWDMEMLKTKIISLQRVVKIGGRSRPRRSIRAWRDSSTAGMTSAMSRRSGEGLPFGKGLTT